jgi:hypothetical protein
VFIYGFFALFALDEGMGWMIRYDSVKAVTGRSTRLPPFREKPVGARLWRTVGEGTHKLRAGNGLTAPAVTGNEVRISQM